MVSWSHGAPFFIFEISNPLSLMSVQKTDWNRETDRDCNSRPWSERFKSAFSSFPCQNKKIFSWKNGRFQNHLPARWYEKCSVRKNTSLWWTSRIWSLLRTERYPRSKYGFWPPKKNILKRYEEQGKKVVFTTGTNAASVRHLLPKSLIKAGVLPPASKRLLIIAVVGVPNTGKSSIINTLRTLVKLRGVKILHPLNSFSRSFFEGRCAGWSHAIRKHTQAVWRSRVVSHWHSRSQEVFFIFWIHIQAFSGHSKKFNSITFLIQQGLFNRPWRIQKGCSVLPSLVVSNFSLWSWFNVQILSKIFSEHGISFF